MLAGADLVNQDLCANILELVACASGASSLCLRRVRLLLRMSLREVAQHFLPVFIDAVQEQVLNFNLVGESAGLIVPHLLDLLLLLVQLSLHADNLVLFILVKGSKEADYLVLHCLVGEVLHAEVLDGWGDVRFRMLLLL